MKSFVIFIKIAILYFSLLLKFLNILSLKNSFCCLLTKIESHSLDPSIFTVFAKVLENVLRKIENVCLFFYWDLKVIFIIKII